MMDPFEPLSMPQGHGSGGTKGLELSAVALTSIYFDSVLSHRHALIVIHGLDNTKPTFTSVKDRNHMCVCFGSFMSDEFQ